MNGKLLFKLCIATALTIQALAVFGQDCEKLADGQYYFKHKTKELQKADFLLIISGDRYTLKKDSQEESKGEILWLSDNCMFKLNADDLATVNIDSLSSIAQILMKSYDGGCYEVSDKKEFRFTHCGNLHITLSEGRILKKRQ